MAKIKSLFSRVVLCMMTCLCFFSGIASASPEDVQYVKEVLKANNDLKSGQSWVTMSLITPVAMAKVDLGSMDILKPEIFAKGDVTVAGVLITGERYDAKIPFYFDEDKDKTALYWNYAGKWYKVIDANNTQEYKDMVEALLLSKLSSESTIMKNAETVFDNGIQRRIEVTVDGKALGQLFREITVLAEKQVKTSDKDKQAQVDFQKKMEFFYASLGDMPMLFTVDVETNRITAMQADLSPTLRAVAVAAAKQHYPQASAEQKQMFDRLLESCTLKIEAVYAMHDKVELKDVAVPDEIAKSATDFIDAVKQDSKAAKK